MPRPASQRHRGRACRGMRAAWGLLLGRARSGRSSSVTHKAPTGGTCYVLRPRSLTPHHIGTHPPTGTPPPAPSSPRVVASHRPKPRDPSTDPPSSCSFAKPLSTTSKTRPDPTTSTMVRITSTSRRLGSGRLLPLLLLLLAAATAGVARAQQATRGVTDGEPGTGAHCCGMKGLGGAKVDVLCHPQQIQAGQPL